MWDLYKAAWEVGLRHFEALPRNADGTRTIAQSYVSEDGFRLGNWHHTQRKATRS